MDEIELHERLSEIKHYLGSRAASPERPYWGFEESELHCWDCVKTVFSDQYGETGGWDGGFACEEDGCCRCEKCGKLLQYSLTDYGVESELAHFEEYPPNDLSDDMCYELERIAYGVWGNEQTQRFVNLMSVYLDKSRQGGLQGHVTETSNMP